MSNYRGFLLKFGNTVFPNNYFLEYSSTPDQRLEASAERTNNGYLVRSTLPNGKTSITFSTHIMRLNEKIAMQNIFAQGLLNSVQRKYQVTFWDDEINNYRSNVEMYMPDIKYTVREATATDILYNPVSIELIQY